jgi:hypothetical protein
MMKLTPRKIFCAQKLLRETLIVQRMTGINELKQCIIWPYSFIQLSQSTLVRTPIIMMKLTPRKSFCAQKLVK